MLSRKFNIDASIIFGNIEILQNSPLGELIIIVKGKEHEIENAISYFQIKNVQVEVIKDGRDNIKLIS